MVDHKTKILDSIEKRSAPSRLLLWCHRDKGRDVFIVKLAHIVENGLEELAPLPEYSVESLPGQQSSQVWQIASQAKSRRPQTKRESLGFPNPPTSRGVALGQTLLDVGRRRGGEESCSRAAHRAPPQERIECSSEEPFAARIFSRNPRKS